MIERQEVVYERLNGTPRGILALFHGCQHSATDFWSKHSSCATCIGERMADALKPLRCSSVIKNSSQCTRLVSSAGLPEEKRIVRSAVARQYVPVAFSSMDREGSRCWDTAPPPTVTLDVQKVAWHMA